jgi:uncharacterized membrane-anchored protein YitT (DUF2179 family)
MWKKGKKNKWEKGKLLWGDLVYDFAGAVLFSAGVYTFAGNADFAPGGVTGLALLLNHVFGIPIGTLTLLINLPLIILSYHALGKRFLLKTARSMVITTVLLDGIFPMFPMYEGQRIMAAVCSGVLIGAGMVLFYMRGSSSGGLDFVIMPIKKKRPHLSVGKITMAIDLGIILLGWPVFGNVDAVLYGLMSTFASVVVIDKVLYGAGAGTLALLVTKQGKAVSERIGQVTERGVTSLQATGAYTGESKQVLLCACNKSEAYLVKRAAEEVDENVFLMFMETSEVFGEGFRNVSEQK